MDTNWAGLCVLGLLFLWLYRREIGDWWDDDF